MFDQVRYYHPYVGPFDPCPPIRIKSFIIPPNLFVPFQPANLPQNTPREALRTGTLWPLFYSPYPVAGKPSEGKGNANYGKREE